MNKVKLNYQGILDKINRSTRINQLVKLDNNTYAEKSGDSIFVILHSSVIADLGINDQKLYRIILYSCGWHTPTTKERLNRILDDNNTRFRIYQESSIWYLSSISPWNKEKYRFSEGITLTFAGDHTPNYSVSNFAVADDSGKIDALKRQIRGYVKRYLDALNQGKIIYPDSQDCLDCQTRDKSKVHLFKHLDSNQFPLILLINAINRFPVSIFAKQELKGIYFQDSDQLLNGQSLHGITINQLTASLSRFLIDQLITNS